MAYVIESGPKGIDLPYLPLRNQLKSGRAMDLFLTASLSSNQQDLSLSPASKCVLLFTLYPQRLTSRTRLTCVLPSGCEISVDAVDLKPLLSLGFESVRLTTTDEMGKELCTGTTPPILRCSDRRLVWFGLSSTVRALVDMGSAEGCPVARGLLGLHKACLKACKEVSKWTMFCEQSLPGAMTRAVTSSVILEPLDVFEEMRQAFHLDAPIHNRNKHLRNMKRWEERRNGKEKEKTSEENDDSHSVSTDKEFNRRIPDTHRFLEGPRKTLVDVVASFFIREAFQQSPAVGSMFEKIAELRQWRFYLKKDAALQGAFAELDRVTVSWSDDKQTLTHEGSDERFSSIVWGIDRMKVSDTQEQLPIDTIVSTFTHLSWEMRSCDDCLASRWDSLPDFVHPRDGDVPESRLRRKCQQLGSIVSAVLPLARPGDTIVDFCSGAGHVGLLLAAMLPQCQVILLENKEESLVRAEARIKRAAGRLDNVHLYKCNLTDFRSTHFRVGVALHACGSATDLVMDACAAAGANFVISPCCYGAIKPNAIVGRFPRSETFRDSGCAQAAFARLRHAADVIGESCGPLAMTLVDSDRLWRASESRRFAELHLLQMSPAECSPKNHILVGKVK